ncbi:NUDIX hydrolase [Oscillospiraceae bacterium 50-58]
MKQHPQWLRWAVELQALAQAGLEYGHDKFDLERYERIRNISAEIMSQYTDLPIEKVKDLFCNESGYQTPKLETRAAIIQDEKILLVQESDGLWSLPGGWADVDITVAENTVKEVREESGLDVVPRLVVALQDQHRHNRPMNAYGVCKVLVLCDLLGGSFQPNLETLDSQWFALDELPPLSTGKITQEQIRLCYDAYHAEHWTTQLD